MAVASPDAEARNRPEGAEETSHTREVWPWRVCRHDPVSASQILHVPSLHTFSFRIKTINNK